MPAYYASFGLFGGILLLGVVIYSVWTQSPPHSEGRSQHNYDRPRNDGWGNEDDQDSSRRRRRTSRSEPFCAICADTIEGINTRTLHCNHTFHFTCILQWFRVKRSCPICRQSA